MKLHRVQQTTIGETKRNGQTWRNKHENPNKASEATKHLRDFCARKFDQKILATAPTNRNLLKTRDLGIINDRPQNTQLEGAAQF